MAKLKAAPKAILIAAVLGIAGYGVHAAMNAGYFKPKATIASSVPDKIDLPTAGANSTTTSGTVIAPITANSADTVKVDTLAWNATMGMHYANGGVDTASGSLMDKHGLKVHLVRQDDYSKMVADLALNAKDPSQGANFVVIMGDGYPAFVKGANDALKQFNTSAEVVGSLGYSRGEDKCVIDANASPKGALIAGVLGDGDINICIKYASDNGIVVNSDPKTYDPNAMNFVGVSAFTDADQKFIAGASDRGHTINGTATWTPGDVNVYDHHPNIKVLASTKEYAWQMPAVVIGNKAWMAAHPDVVKAFLAASFEGGEAVRSDDSALLKGAAVEAKVYGEQDANYWATYFKGTTKGGIALGGSTTSGLADNAFLFGLKGNDNLYKKVYDVYGKIAVKYFPDNLPALVPYGQVVNTTYVQALLDSATNVGEAAKPVYGGQKSEVVANKSYSIEFETGKATLKPASIAVLNDLLDQIAVSSLSVQVNGHTDNVGDPNANLALSKARAETVKQFLMANASGNFPSERITTRGYGDTQPVADNSTAAGKAKNRRVEVVLFSTK